MEYEACVKRIESDTTGEAHCTGQYFDYFSCIDACAAKPRAVLWHYWLSDATLAGQSKCRMDRTRPCMYPCSCLVKLCFKTCTSYCHQLCNDEADDASSAGAVNATGNVEYPAEAMGAGEVAVLAVALVLLALSAVLWPLVKLV